MRKFQVVMSVVVCGAGFVLLARTPRHATSVAVASPAATTTTAFPPEHAPDSISAAALAAIQPLAGQEGLPDFADLERIVPPTIRAMATGDGPALRAALLERHAAPDPKRVAQLRNGMRESPNPPPRLAQMADDEVIAYFNSKATAALQIDNISFNAVWCGKRRVFDDSDIFLTPPVSQTPNRKAFLGEPLRLTEMCYSAPTAFEGRAGNPEVVVFEFACTTDKGRMLVCIAFAHYPDTGWIPRAKATIGAPYLAPL